MTDEKPASQIPLRDQYPGLRILDTAQIALSPASVVIAAITAALLGLASGLLDRAAPPLNTNENISVEMQTWPMLIAPVPPAVAFFGAELVRPWLNVVEPAVLVMTAPTGFGRWLVNLVRFALALAVWSIVGMILCRRSAVLLVGNDESTVRRAIQYSLKRWGSAASAPLIPAAAALLMGLAVALAGLIGQLPYLGSLLLYVTSPITAIVGFMMAILFLAAICGWPLMVAAVAIDDCDSFGGLSRAHSELTGRPWYVIGYGLVSLLLGSVMLLLAMLVGSTTIWCALTFARLGGGDQVIQQSLVSPVTGLVHGVVVGVGISFFWSAATVIHLLLRQAIDGVPIERMALDDELRTPREPLPVVGIPATDSVIVSNGKVHSESS